MALHILITGTSGAISRITKSMVDRCFESAEAELAELSASGDLSTSAKYDCAVINNLMADEHFRIPAGLNGIPTVLITSNEKILSEPGKFGLFAAIKNSSGGAAGITAFEQELHSIIERAVSGKHHDCDTKSAPDTNTKTVQSSTVKTTPYSSIITTAEFSFKTSAKPKAPVTESISHSGNISLIAIGASTGGTDAIIEVVKDLPADCPPVVIVQHMPEGFTKMYADRLDRVCKMQAKEAEDGDRLRNGLIILGHGSRQLEVHKDASGFYVTSRPGEKVSGHCPSVDVLFRSVAKVSGKGTIGVILTGMGRDGAYGLGDMRKAGAYTIGQDEPSCIVYGMPCVAYEEGAVIKQAPLDEINSIITEML